MVYYVIMSIRLVTNTLLNFIIKGHLIKPCINVWKLNLQQFTREL